MKSVVRVGPKGRRDGGEGTRALALRRFGRRRRHRISAAMIPLTPEAMSAASPQSGQ